MCLVNHPFPSRDFQLICSGDKSAHVATLHLPQMLYFWPYVVFFSLPLVIGSLLRPVLPFLPRQIRSLCENHIARRSAISLPSLWSTLLFCLCGLVAVHYNTVVHPYTLADNRHYVFYAFRILRGHQAIKYLAVPTYYICAWMTVQTLGEGSGNEAEVKRDLQNKPPASKETSRQSCPMSFIVIWVAATTLSVITAPLVEPRYFIIPWIIWRLHVPNFVAPTTSGDTKTKAALDSRLVLETMWLLSINIGICYNFLYRGYAWPSEPGKIQRFLW